MVYNFWVTRFQEFIRMSKKVPLSQHRVCWVPVCDSKFDYNKKFYNLSAIQPSKLREIWLALARKPTEGLSEDQIFFCEDHFQINCDQLVVDEVMYSQASQSELIPNFKMPAKVCRTCSEFINPEDPVYTISYRYNLKPPQNIETEYKIRIDINPEPLFDVFKFCFSEFNLPTDPVAIACAKCYENVWLFFAFKRRAICVENYLSENMTAEEYGKKFLCRTCTTDPCSNFFPVSKDSDQGALLLSMFDKKYPPDIVPLRICLNCHIILQKLNNFHKSCLTSEKMTKMREMMNTKKLKVNTNFESTPKIAAPPTITSQSDREAGTKRVEKENILLAKLMLDFGRPLRNNLHNLENWKPICKKLEEKGINHNIPSLINNWRSLVKGMVEKMQRRETLSVLDELVLNYERLTRGPGANMSVSNDSPSRPAMRCSVIQSSSSSEVSSAESPTVNLSDKNSQEGIVVKVHETPSDKVCTFPIDVQKLFLRVIGEEYNELLLLQSKDQLNLGNTSAWHAILDRIAFKGKFPNGDLVDVKRLLSFLELKSQEIQAPGHPDQPMMQEFRSLQKAIGSLARQKAVQIPPSNNPILSPQKHIPEPLNAPLCTNTVQKTEKPEKPFSTIEKFDLIRAMSQFRDINSIPGDPSTVSNVWPDVMKILRDKGSQRDLEFVKNAWTEMKQNSQRAVNDNLILDDIDRHMKLFMRDAGQGAKKLEVTNKFLKNGFLKSPRKNTVKAVKPGIKKTKPNKNDLAPGGPRKVGRPKTATFGQKLELARAMRIEYDLSTLEERKQKGLWQVLLQRVNEKHITDENMNRLSNLWGSLKTSAKIHVKDGSDLVDEEVWGIMQQHEAERALDRSPSKSPMKVQTPAKEVYAIKTALNYITRVTPTPSPNSTASPSSFKRCLDGALATCSSTPESYKETDTSHDRSNSAKKLKSSNNDPLDLSARLSNINPLADTAEAQSIFLKRQLLTCLKDTYKQMSKNGELVNCSKRIWVSLIARMYDEGFNIIPKEKATKIWKELRTQMFRDVSRGRQLSEFEQEVHRFMMKIKNNEFARKREQVVPPVAKKLSPTIKKKKPYEKDDEYKPRVKLPEENATEEKPKRASANFSINEDSMEATDQVSERWTPEETDIFLSILDDFMPAFNTKTFWNSVHAACEKRGIKKGRPYMRWNYLKRRFEKFKVEKRPLTDTHKKVENLMEKMNEIRSRNLDCNTEVTTEKDSPIIPDTVTSDPKLPSSPVQVKRESQPEPQAAEPSQVIDLTYEYVSWQDLQQSSSWDVPPKLKPMIEEDESKNIGFKVAKIEGGVSEEHDTGGGSRSVDEEDTDSRESRDDNLINHGYVGVNDLQNLTINLTSDEE